MRHIGRRFGALVGVVAAVLCGGLTLQTAQAVPMSAQFAPMPNIPVAPSVLGGTLGTATGGAATATTAGGVATIAGTTALAAAVYFGTAYGTYSLLHWAFSGTTEAGGAQPVPSDYPGINLPDRKLGRCQGAASTGGAVTDLGPQWSIPASPGCPNGTVAVTAAISGSVTLPAWRCRDGATGCAIAVLALGAGGVAVTGYKYLLSGSSSPGGVLSWSYPANVLSAPAYGWLFVGDPTKIEWLPAPLHRWRTITTCKNRSSGATTTMTNLSAQFVEADAQLPDMQVPQCASGWVGTQLQIWEGDDTGAGGILRYGWTAPADVSNPVTTQTSPYKSCYPGGADAPCILTIYKVQPDQSLAKCDGQTVDCSSYDHVTTTTTQYRCLWGIHSMPISDCEGLESWVRTNTPVQPTTSTSVQPTTGTSVQVLPTTGQNIDPKTGLPRTDTTGPAPDTTDNTSSNCMGGAWSWNPVNWVLIPVKCALQWAFVPQASTMSSLSTRATTALSASAPGQWVGAVDGLRSGLTVSEAGCQGPFIPFFKLPGGGFYPLAACSGVMAQIAGITKTVLTVVISLFGGLACLRALGSGLGWSPGVGSGGDD